MDSVNLIICFLLVFVKTLHHVEAGIFDPMLNIFATPETMPNKVIDPFLSPMRASDEEVPEHRTEGRGETNTNAWWEIDATTSPVIDDVFKYQERTTRDYDKIVANRFPGAVNLLEKLKELNKLKDQQKQNNSGSENKSTPNPFYLDEDRETNDNDDREKTTEKTKKNGLTKHLTKSKFYFQVQPVRPVGEYVKTKETVYYVDD